MYSHTTNDVGENSHTVAAHWHWNTSPRLPNSWRVLRFKSHLLVVLAAVFSFNFYCFCALPSTNASRQCSSSFFCLLFGNLWKWRTLIAWYLDSGIVTTNSASSRCSRGNQLTGRLDGRGFSTFLPSDKNMSWYRTWPSLLLTYWSTTNNTNAYSRHLGGISWLTAWLLF